ncbi:MAG: hypothetical protein JWN78_2077 [Bacteroidota bacterium]|nr:hypothetical protein [Bacteroidota bacterium]
MEDFHYTITSEIHTDRETLWKHITQMKNVNAELMPFARMTYPADKSEIGNNEIPLHQTLFKSLVLLFGFIPADLHFLRLDKIDNGKAFYENSVTAMHRYWKHTRTITERDGKTFLQDELHFLPRIYPAGYCCYL